MMSPAALSILTTTFTSRRDRNLALGAWAAVPGLAGASGVVLSGVLTQGPGWRWIFYLNVPVADPRGLGALVLLGGEPRVRGQRGFDVPGAVLVTAGMLLLIYTLVRAPEIGWSAPRRSRARGRGRRSSPASLRTSAAPATRSSPSRSSGSRASPPPT